jgi:DNA-binding NtrC family response regulator
MTALTRYPWPGNIRELDNVIARAVVLTTQDQIGPEQLNLAPPEPIPTGGDSGDYSSLPYHESMEEHSRRVIINALRFCGGSQTRAAERLKLQRTYLARLIKQKNINPDQPN